MNFPYTVRALAEATRYIGTAVIVERWLRDASEKSGHMAEFARDCEEAAARDYMPPVLAHNWGERILILDDHYQLDLGGNTTSAMEKQIGIDLEVLAAFWSTVKDEVERSTNTLTRNMRELYQVQIGIMEEIVDYVAETRTQSPRTAFNLDMVK